MRAVCAGAAAMLLGLTFVGGPAAARHLGIDLQRHKPVWLLLRESLAVPPSPRALAAISELQDRCMLNEIDTGAARRIADRVLGAQADLTRPWHPELSELLLAVLPHHEDPHPAFERYIRQTAPFQVRTDVSYYENSPLPFDLFLDSPRIGHSDSWWIYTEIESLRVNGVEFKIDHNDPRPSNTALGRWLTPWDRDVACRIPFSVWAENATGESTVELTWTISAMTGDASAAWARNIHRKTELGAGPEEFMEDWEDYGTAKWTHTWSGTIRVLPPTYTRYVTSDDSIPVDEIDRCLTDVRISAGRTPDGVALWLGGVFRNPPLDLAYEVRIETPFGSKPLGLVGGLADETAGFFLRTGVESLDASLVTLRFVPRADYASRRQGMMLIDSRELRREHIPVDWIAP
jgi:hypothetical protein